VLRIVKSGSNSVALQRPVQRLVDSAHHCADTAHVQSGGLDGGNPGPLAMPVVEQHQGCPCWDESAALDQAFIEAAHGDECHRGRLAVVEEEGRSAQDEAEVVGLLGGGHRRPARGLM
jgi:hypothetical protein